MKCDAITSKLIVLRLKESLMYFDYAVFGKILIGIYVICTRDYIAHKSMFDGNVTSKLGHHLNLTCIIIAPLFLFIIIIFLISHAT